MTRDCGARGDCPPPKDVSEVGEYVTLQSRGYMSQLTMRREEYPDYGGRATYPRFLWKGQYNTSGS